jgi:hypothetical protein
MRKPTVKFPVVCRECQREVLTSLSIPVVADALICGKTIRLHANCHDKWWDASPIEVEQIREYIGATVMAARLKTPSKSKNGQQIPQVTNA